MRRRLGSSAQFSPPCDATYKASSSRLHTPSLSNTPRSWFLMTCSVQPSTSAISGLVFPCHTIVATCTSFGLNCSRGDTVHLLLLEHGRSQNYAFPTLLDPGAQKQSAQVLLNCPRADV